MKTLRVASHSRPDLAVTEPCTRPRPLVHRLTRPTATAHSQHRTRKQNSASRLHSATTRIRTSPSKTPHRSPFKETVRAQALARAKPANRPRDKAETKPKTERGPREQKLQKERGSGKGITVAAPVCASFASLRSHPDDGRSLALARDARTPARTRRYVPPFPSSPPAIDARPVARARDDRRDPLRSSHHPAK